jgi:hypothetical protein
LAHSSEAVGVSHRRRIRKIAKLSITYPVTSGCLQNIIKGSLVIAHSGMFAIRRRSIYTGMGRVSSADKGAQVEPIGIRRIKKIYMRS